MQHDGLTWINAPIVPVTLDLRNFDGSSGQSLVNGQPLISSPAAFVSHAHWRIPRFSRTRLIAAAAFRRRSPTPSQRAEFFKSAKPDWHTMLVPSVKTGRTMVLIRGTYAFSLNADGSCCRYVLVDANTFVNALFPSTPTDTTTPIGAAENAGDITTQDLSTFLFPEYLSFHWHHGQLLYSGFPFL